LLGGGFRHPHPVLGMLPAFRSPTARLWGGLTWFRGIPENVPSRWPGGENQGEKQEKREGVSSVELRKIKIGDGAR